MGANEGRYDPPHNAGCGRSGFSGVSKVKITAWVAERPAFTIKGLSAQQGVPVSEMCAQKPPAALRAPCLSSEYVSYPSLPTTSQRADEPGKL